VPVVARPFGQGVVLVLETDDNGVGVPHHDDVPVGVAMPSGRRRASGFGISTRRDGSARQAPR